ncbi:hypothetical protein B484DRAFT_432154, partial [Ochromonadaceae sp. CCMP2298]
MQPFLCGAARSHPTNNAYSNGTDAFSAGTDGTVAASAPHCVSFFAVCTTTDPQFQASWYDIFLKYEGLRVPWKFVLGNHDYMGNPQAQHPDTPLQLQASIGHLREGLKTAPEWKIVFGHHPVYTQGRGHGVCAKILREVPESGLAKKLNSGQRARNLPQGSGLYQGWDLDEEIDWVCDGKDYGFLACQIFYDKMIVRYVTSEGKVLKEVVVPRCPRQEGAEG